jgi:hypothetical protein
MVDRFELFRQASNAYEMRSKAFGVLAKREAGYRSLVNLAAAMMVAAVILAEWDNLLTGRAVFLCAIAWIVVRTFGGAFVNVWASRLIQRVKDEWPLPPGSDSHG